MDPGDSLETSGTRELIGYKVNYLLQKGVVHTIEWFMNKRHDVRQVILSLTHDSSCAF